MKITRFFGFLAMVVVVLLACGCEDHGRDGPYQNDYGYNGYYNQSYVSVEVRNDYWAYIGVIVGDALVGQVPPGQSWSVPPRKLIGDEKLRISILFYDQYGNPTVRSGEISFNRDYDSYNLDVMGPDNIEKH